jgi:hypothetical protein
LGYNATVGEKRNYDELVDSKKRFILRDGDIEQYFIPSFCFHPSERGYVFTYILGDTMFDPNPLRIAIDIGATVKNEERDNEATMRGWHVLRFKRFDDGAVFDAVRRTMQAIKAQ